VQTGEITDRFTAGAQQPISSSKAGIAPALGQVLVVSGPG